MPDLKIDATPLLVDVSTKLLENYRSVEPAPGGGTLAIIVTADGPIIAGISSTNHGYVLVQDKSSDSGWSSISLGLATLNGALAAVTDSQGKPHVFASGAAALLHATKTGPAPTDWSPLEPVPQIGSGSQIVALRNADFTHVAAVTGTSVSYGVESAATPGTFQWFAGVVPATYPGGGPLTEMQLLPSRNGTALIATLFWPALEEAVLYEGDGANWSQTSVDTDAYGPQARTGLVVGDEVIVFGTEAGAFSAWAQPAAGASWIEIGGIGTDDLLMAFNPWIDGLSGRVCGLVAGFSSANYASLYFVEALTSPPQANQWSFTSLAGGEPPVIAPNPPDSTAIPQQNFSILADPVTGLMRGFAIDLNSNLCVIEQRLTGWTPLLPTGHQAVALYPINNPDGYSQVVAVDGDGIYILSYSSATQEWTRTDLELSLPDEAYPYDSYSTEITVTDANGVFQPEASVLVKCSSLMQARVNGAMISLDDENPVPLTTNVAGRITIETAIDSLNCPEIFVQLPTMETGAWVSVVPQLEVRDKISAAVSSVDTFLAQKDRNGNYVVNGRLRQEPLRAEQVSMAIARCCDLAATAGTQLAATAGPLARNRLTDRVRYLPPGAKRTGRHLNYAKVEPISWSLDFRSGAPVFRVLSDAEAAAAIGPLGLLPDWGSVWDAIKDGVSDLQNLVVRIVVDPVTNEVIAIEASVTALIEDVQRVYSATVDVVEQVFDVVQGIFTKIETYFEELIEWLAFFFAWHDIKLVKYAVEYLITQSYQLFDGMMASQQSALPAMMRGVGSSIQDWYGGSRGPVGSRSVSSLSDQNSSPAFLVEGLAHNIVQSNLFDAISSVLPLARFPSFTPEMTASLATIGSLLEQLSDAMAAQPAYGSVNLYFQSMIEKLASDPNAFLETALEDILGALVAFAGAAIDLTAALLEQLIALLRQVAGLFASVLDTEIDIPIITPLYELLTGDTLTFVDVISLAAAVGITLSYKIAYDEAPLTSESLGTFEEDWAASNLLALAGMGPFAGHLKPAGEPGSKSFANVCLMFAYALGGVCCGVADFQRREGDTGTTVSVIAATVDLTVWVLETPWAGFVSDPISGPPTIISADGLVALSFILDGIACFIDVGSILQTKHKVSFEKYGPLVMNGLGLLQWAFYAGVIFIQNQKGEWDKNAQLNDIGSVLVYLPSVTEVLVLADDPRPTLAQIALDLLTPIVGGAMIFGSNMSSETDRKQPRAVQPAS